MAENIWQETPIDPGADAGESGAVQQLFHSALANHGLSDDEINEFWELTQGGTTAISPDEITGVLETQASKNFAQWYGAEHDPNPTRQSGFAPFPGNLQIQIPGMDLLNLPGVKLPASPDSTSSQDQLDLWGQASDEATSDSTIVTWEEFSRQHYDNVVPHIALPAEEELADLIGAEALIPQMDAGYERIPEEVEGVSFAQVRVTAAAFISAYKAQVAERRAWYDILFELLDKYKDWIIVFQVLWQAYLRVTNYQIVHAINAALQGILEFSKGGKQNLKNEYYYQAQSQREVDPCEYLRQLYNSISDNAERDKIKKAQKEMGCRRSTQKPGR